MTAPSSSSSSTPPASDRWRRLWRSRRWPAWGLLPLAGIYAALSALPRVAYRLGWRRAQHAGVPTIVIGNVIAGGAGKTPVTLATVAHLRTLGWRPGIISRGYGRHTNDCRPVTPHSHPHDVGDEPLLMAQASGVPVFVARQRIDAARALLAQHPEVNVLVCDDGLQHLALARDIEVCVFNDEGTGNGWLLPAGPLREAWPRAVDAVLYAGAHAPAGTPEHLPQFRVQRSLAPQAHNQQGVPIPLAQLRNQPLHAVAAIARPEDFFAMLRAQGLTLARTEGLPDHYNFESFKSRSNLDLKVICTEKDAAKLWPYCPQALAVGLHVAIDDGYFQLLTQRLGLSSSPPPSTLDCHGPETA